MPDGRIIRIIRLFATMRWRMLRGILRSDGAQKWAVLVGLVAAVLIGTAAGLAIFVTGRRTDDAETLFVIVTAATTMLVVMVSVIAGIAQPVDPRVLATEPVTDRQLGLGLLAASAVGPPGTAALLVGVGLVAGAVRTPAGLVPAVVAVVVFLGSLLLVSRSTVNALGLFATRFPRAGQVVVGLASLVFYAAFQVVPRVAGDVDEQGRTQLADALVWSPPGQLGRALAMADDEPLQALGHAAIGALWLVPLLWLFVATTRHLLVATPRTTGTTPAVDGRRRKGTLGTLARRLCGEGPVGAVAWRGVLTRVRTPRSALEAVTGAGIGLAIVLVPTLARDGVGAGAVLVGGAVQLAVLFMAGNSFGADGPALADELLTGIDPDVLVRGKARSIVVVALPVAIAGPVLAAAVTAEWNHLVAGLLVGFGALLAGTGGAIVQSTLVPVAIPQSDNPLATGDSGKGCMAGLLIGVVVTVLAVVTLPVALALLWAVDRGSLVLVTVFAAATLGVGAAVLRFATRYTVGLWRRREPEIYAAVVPAR